MRLSPRDQLFLNRDVAPWALAAGEECEDLMCVNYETCFLEPLDALRARLKIKPNPLPRDSSLRMSTYMRRRRRMKKTGLNGEGGGEKDGGRNGEKG